MIAIHHYVHFASNSHNIVTYIISAHFGYLFVSLFFLLSAYGLTEAESAKRQSFGLFLKKRLFKICQPFIIMNIIALAIYGLVGYRTFSAKDVFLYTFGIKLIDPVCWYILVSLMLYIFFWISFQFKRNCYRVAVLLLLSVLYMLAGHFYFHLPENIYMSVLSFPLGMSLSLYKEQIWQWIRNRYFLVYNAVYVFAILAVAFGFHKLGINMFQTICMSFILVPTYLFISYKDVLKLKVLDFFGNISYEIYLVHMKVLVLMRLFISGYTNLASFMLLVLVFAYLFSLFLSFINKRKTNKVILTN